MGEGAERSWREGRGLTCRGWWFPDSGSSGDPFPNPPPNPSTAPPDPAALGDRGSGRELLGPSWSGDSSDGTGRGNPTWQLSDRAWSDIRANKGSVFPGRGSCPLVHPWAQHGCSIYSPCPPWPGAIHRPPCLPALGLVPQVVSTSPPFSTCGPEVGGESGGQGDTASVWHPVLFTL